MAVIEEIDRPSQEECDSHYKAGSIKRVKLTNFLTYDSVEFTPGPRLNIVVGPNGTGKSTILCAICLGLGGQPPLLGRADDARLFIKHEMEQAIIEIELAPHRNSNGRAEAVHVIKRVIDRDRGSEHGKGAGASTYFINGHKSTLKSVKELVSERYHIHIDNLCTFLPQDKVGNFSGFDKQALLVETEKSLSGHLYNTHQDLIKLEKELHSSGTDVASIENELAKLTKENERLEREKELMEQRQSFMEKIDLLKKKKLYLIFDIKREDAKAAKERREELKKKKKVAERSLRPLAEKHTTVEGSVSRIQSKFKSLDIKVKKDKRSHEDLIAKADRFSDEVENEMSAYQTIDAQQRASEREVEKQRASLEQLEAEGSSFPLMGEVEQSISQFKSEARSVKVERDRARQQIQDFVERIEQANGDKGQASKHLDRLKDDKKLRRDKFFHMFPNVGQAHNFIEPNRKMFRRPIWGPIAAEVQPKDQGTAACLEYHVSNATWKSYVVECKEDYDLLYREVREKRKIPINIIIVEHGRLEPLCRMYSDQRMDVLRREHGFFGFLDETFTAPDPIMQALIIRNSVDKVLVGGEAVHNSVNNNDLIEYLSTREDGRPGKQSSCFFYTYKGTTLKYTCQVSRYSGEIGVDGPGEISRARLLKPGSDPGVKQRLAESIAKVDEIIAKLEPEVNDARAKQDEYNAQGEAIIQQLREAQRTKADYRQYEVKLRGQRDKLAEAQENASKDNDKEKAKTVAKMKKLVENSITMQENAGKMHNEIMKHTHILTGVKMAEDGLSESLRKLADQLQERQAETAELTNQYKTADAEYNKKKDSLKKLREEAETIAPWDQWKERFGQEGVPNTLEGVEDVLDEAENKVNSITDNPHVMRQYEERIKEIQKLQKQLDEADGEKGMKRTMLQTKLDQWEAKLMNIVKKVNEKFSAYMKEVGCAGEVRLYTGQKEARENDEEDNLCYNFKNWGVEILVKFREASSLQVLSAQTHSGGERSVSTIMFLMGLQNLMTSPFRCVDEINQGLDERNERLVFKRIVKNSTIPAGSSNSDHCGQYFLITPKLLPNLDGMENEDITVLFVFSGAHNFHNCLDWNVDKFIEEKKNFLTQDEERNSGTKRKSR